MFINLLDNKSDVGVRCVEVGYRLEDLSWLKEMADKSDVEIECVKVGVKCQMS